MLEISITARLWFLGYLSVDLSTFHSLKLVSISWASIWDTQPAVGPDTFGRSEWWEVLGHLSLGAVWVTARSEAVTPADSPQPRPPESTCLPVAQRHLPFKGQYFITDDSFVEPGYSDGKQRNRSQTFEFGANSGCCGEFPWMPPRLGLRRLSPQLPAVLISDNVCQLYLCLRPCRVFTQGQAHCPEYNPIQGPGWYSGRGLFSLHSGTFCTRTPWRMGQALCWTVSTSPSAHSCSILSSTRIYSERFPQ